MGASLIEFDIYTIAPATYIASMEPPLSQSWCCQSEMIDDNSLLVSFYPGPHVHEIDLYDTWGLWPTLGRRREGA